MQQGEKNGILSEKLENFERICNQERLKITPQRIEIFKEIAESSDHWTAEAIYKKIKKKMPTLSLDTVYRTIATFESPHWSPAFKPREYPARFEVEREKHHHLICTRCGELTGFPWHSFDTAVIPPQIVNWGMIEKRNAKLLGICRKCSKSPEKT